MAQTKGAGWIRRIQEWAQKEDEERPARIQLRECGLEGGSVPILEWKLKDEIDPEDIRQKVQEFLSEAQEHANNSSQAGPIACAVFAVDDEGSILGKSSSRKFFNEDPPDELGSLEGPTPKGLTAQLMRHNEVMFLNSQRANTETIRMLTDQVTQLQSAFSQIESRRFEAFERLEEAMTLKHERELEARKRESDQAAREKLMGEVIPMLRVMGPKLLMGLGKKAGVVADSGPLEQGSSFWHVIDGLAAIIHSLPASDMMKLYEVVGEERAIALNELFEQAEKLRGNNENGR